MSVFDLRELPLTRERRAQRAALNVENGSIRHSVQKSQLNYSVESRIIAVGLGQCGYVQLAERQLPGPGRGTGRGTARQIIPARRVLSVR